jgi:toxin HigB-1
MIVSFACHDTSDFHRTGKTRRGWQSVAKVAKRKLDQLAAATVLDDLRSPPGNRLEPLTGDRAGQHSIRINDQWRVCFVWTDNGPTDVEITDYH